MELVVDILLHFIASVIGAIFMVYCWNHMSKIKFKDKVLKSIASVLIICIFAMLIQEYIPQYFKIECNIIIAFLVNFCLLSKNIKTSLVHTFMSQIIIMFSEIMYLFLSQLLFGKSFTGTPNNVIDVIISNYATITIAFITFHFISTLKSFIKIMETAKQIKRKEIILNISILMSITLVTTTASFLKWEAIYILLINISIIFLFMKIMSRLIINQNKLETTNKKYQTSITSLKEYETMIDKFRVYNHENKNELLTIRNMLKDKKTIEYIDKLVDNKIRDNERIMYKTSKIPEGGLRATIYSKLCIMDEYKIKYNLNISNDVRTADLININDELTLNICKILGVFLDNAIDAVKELSKKIVNIEIYIMDDRLCIDISNDFKGKLDINKIGSQRYTTKGENHGYGLSLVNKIIKDNSTALEKETSISRNMFIQSLKIKM